ncbi:MAG TPA: cob(I)yrinic acid a,c-diamide adenosyltransferase [Gallionella sp.]|nr:cob(I)yrinic acid a,c-diamide adenosyltransferase [Gallionella sp.]
MSDQNSVSADEKHRARAQRHKEIVDAKIASATENRGVVLVHTGNGKGKSSAAFGMIARALGHNMRVGVVQFIKGSYSTGEEAFFRRIPEVEYHVMGDGFTWETQDKERDIASAQAAWDVACAMLRNPDIALVVLDEINIALKLHYLQIEQVLEALRNRPAMQHVVLTGRAAPDELIAYADTVTEMRPIKHAFEAGIQAQKGIEL